MSVTLTLIPAAIAIGVSLSSAGIASALSLASRQKAELAAAETIFCDSAILQKTLEEHGMKLKKLSENEYVAALDSGTLRYFRTAEDSPFYLEVSGVSNMSELLESLDLLENEYGRNVQAFTYDRVLLALKEHGMTVSGEEVMEDESVVITLNL